MLFSPDTSALEWLLSAWALCASVLWCAAAGRAARGARALGRLKDQAPPDPAHWPKLSVLIAACNEADTLNEALQTGPVSDDVRVLLDDELARHDMGEALLRALRTERAFGLERFRTLPGAGTWLARGFYNLWKLDYLKLMDWYLATKPDKVY